MSQTAAREMGSDLNLAGHRRTLQGRQSKDHAAPADDGAAISRVTFIIQLSHWPFAQ
jgi:hypothetical protein